MQLLSTVTVMTQAALQDCRVAGLGGSGRLSQGSWAGLGSHPISDLSSLGFQLNVPFSQ